MSNHIPQTTKHRKLELHYIANSSAMRLAETFFLPSIAQGFQPIQHYSTVETTGNFLEDNFRKVLEERTSWIVKEIATKLDGSLMLWCDIDVVFFEDCAEELIEFAGDNDLVFQAEHSWGDICNFGLQLIRRNEKTLTFYQSLLAMQRRSFNGNDQDVGNQLLQSQKQVKWSRLPRKFSSESNGGILCDSLLYHSNCTARNSLTKKHGQLEAACIMKGFFAHDSVLSETGKGSPRAPVYAYSPYGLGNRILGLASTIELCRIFDRQLILLWENNRDIGHAHFNDIFSNAIPIIGNKPPDVDSVHVFYKERFNLEDFPNDRPIIMWCDDVLEFPGITESTIKPHLRRRIFREVHGYPRVII